MPTYKQWKESPSEYQTEPIEAYNYWKFFQFKSNFISSEDKLIKNVEQNILKWR